MAANRMSETNVRNSRRIKASLVTEDLKPNDHPLHLFVSRRNAKLLNVSDSGTVAGFFISLWTNTKCVPTPSTSHPAVPGQRSIFQRMLSNSQNFPDILFPFSNRAYDNKVEEMDVVTGIDTEIFVQVWVREIDKELPSDTIVLTCNSKFLTHYNIQSTDVYVRCVKLYPVNRAVLGVSSPEAFQWLTRYEFCKRMLGIVETNKILIRTKDVFLSPYGDFFEDDPDFKRQFYFDIYVLECLPVQQGIITKSTEIILTFLEDLAIEKETEQRDLESLKVNPRRGISGLFKDVLISEFSHALRQNYLNTPEIEEHSDDIKQAFRDKANVVKSIKLRTRKPSDIVGKFAYKVVSQESTFRRILWRDSKKISFDPMYFVGMSRKQMIKEGLFDGSVVVISPQYQDNDYDDDKSEYIIEKICMVRCLGKEFDRSRKLSISPLCLFNILRMPPIEMPVYLMMKRYDTGKVDNDCSSRSGKEYLPVAKEVRISIIPSPNYSPRAPHDEALKQYFMCNRVVAKGDVIAIKSSDDPMFWQNTGDDTENRFPCIYFKVVIIRAEDSSHQNYITDINTTLIQIGSEHSYIPVMMQTYLSCNEQGFWDKKRLPGLTSYVQKLENYILPHITAKQNSKILKSVPPAILVAGPVGCGKTTLIVTVARRLGVHCYKVNCHSLVGDSSGTTEERMKKGFNAAGLYSPCILLLQSVHALGRDRDANNDPRIASSFLSNVTQLKNDLQQFPMILVATTHSEKYLSHDILDCFLHQVTIEAPTEIERSEIVDSLLHTMNCSGNISIAYIAQRTAGFVLGDLAALAAHAKREAFRRLVKMCSGNIRPNIIEEEDLLAAGVVVQQADFQTALDQLQAAHSDAIGAAKIPNVRWDDIGGLMNVKRDILDTIQLPLQYPELLAAGLRRSGVLLYGPPGTGKTLLAKAVATECSLNFLSVKGPELINMYVGQSEQNIREVFQRARSATPCVIFFDELDSLAPNRGRSGDSGGVMDRLVSQLLAELDGLNKACDVFVIGATNRPDLLDSALLRPGRFDKILYLGVSEDHQSQLRILLALTRKFNIADGFNMETFVEKCPFTLTGADFYALASDAMLNALKKKIKKLEEGESVDQTIIVDEDDFNVALDNLSPSVSQQELERYKQLREQFHVKENVLTSVTSKLFEIADVYDEKLSTNFSSTSQQDSVRDSC